MARALTVKAIERLRPVAVRVEIGDGGTRGLRLAVQPSGAKSWVFRYRSPLDGRPKKFTIGAFEAFSLAEAREEAHQLRRAIAKGVDPGEEKRAAKARAADASRDVSRVLDRFLAEHVVSKRPSTAKLMRQQVEADIRPAWGRRRIETISRADVASLVGRIADRGAKVSANRVFSTVRKFLNWCAEPKQGLIEDSPARGMRRPSEEAPRNRVLTDNELLHFWIATSDGSSFAACARLLLLTGQRRMEVGGMRWSELALDGSQPIWTIPAARTKNKREHIVPLTKSVVRTLNSLERIDGSDLVFTTNGRDISSSWSKAKRALDAAIAQAKGDGPIEHWTLHDLRRTCATGLARLRQPPHVIEAVLNHKSGQVSGIAAIYNVFEYQDEKATALQAWELHLLTLVGGGANSNVVALRG